MKRFNAKCWTHWSVKHDLQSYSRTRLTGFKFRTSIRHFKKLKYARYNPGLDTLQMVISHKSSIDKSEFSHLMRNCSIYSLCFERERHTHTNCRYCTKVYTVKAQRAIQITLTQTHTHIQQCSHRGTQHQCSLQMLFRGKSYTITHTAGSKQRSKNRKASPRLISSSWEKENFFSEDADSAKKNLLWSVLK